MPVKVNEREYRNIDLCNMEVRQMDDGQMVVEGYATKWNEYPLWEDGDYIMYESFDPHAFDETDLSDDIFQLNHEGRVYARGSNGTLIVKPDEVGLFFRAYLGGTEEGRKIYDEIKGGYLTKMSHGFRSDRESEKRDVREVGNRIEIHRRINRVVKHYDVSVVSLPANDATEISSRNLGEGVIAEVKQEMQARAARERTKKQIEIIAGGITK